MTSTILNIVICFPVIKSTFYFLNEYLIANQIWPPVKEAWLPTQFAPVLFLISFILDIVQRCMNCSFSFVVPCLNGLINTFCCYFFVKGSIFGKFRPKFRIFRPHDFSRDTMSTCSRFFKSHLQGRSYKTIFLRFG